MESEAAVAYAIISHAIQLAIPVILGVWSLKRMNIDVGDILSEVRNRETKWSDCEDISDTNAHDNV